MINKNIQHRHSERSEESKQFVGITGFFAMLRMTGLGLVV